MASILKYAVLLTLTLSTCMTTQAETTWPGKKSDFRGFDRYSFKFADKNAWIKVPKKPLPGNPWVWRGRWADFHTDADTILLERGFFIVYLDTGNMLGCDKALDLWDKFYVEMTEKYKLAKKPALEAVSRGGLFVLRWAARHPEKVSCIFLDSAVCDIKSWPLGKGEGDHDETGIRQLGEYYGLKTEADILAFKKNPVDDVVVKPIAEAKIPILALVNKDDHIVPPAENIEVFAKRYKDLGAGNIEIMHPDPKAKTSLKGHHFPEPNPARVADFIAAHTLAANM